ncbi:MAG TPA: PQQ-dependent sugar dehydrogenase [Vicinamibacterales bacterium]|nr:PQQ-dependent sugar dehydrogenase [Vicinamibacterales bacterium]
MKLWVAAFVAAVCALPMNAQAQIKSEVVASGLSKPLGFIPDPAFANVHYIVQQAGLVRVLRDGQLQSAPFIDLTGIARLSGGEQGLLGMAFAPDVASGRVFFHYTDVNGDHVVSRYRRSAGSPLRLDPSTRFDIRWPTGGRVLSQPFSNHNGGHLIFGPDGYLYIGLGDGGSGNDPTNKAQDPTSLLGKMLRLDVNVADGDDVGYRVPADNPFVDGQPIVAMPEIWAVGFRNPWRYTFDDLGPDATGALIIADVGQGQREEINYEPRNAGGRNYGWRIREGRIATPNVPPTSPAFGPLVDPIFDYSHTDGRSITGGYIYRGTGLGASYRGRYFYADFVRARVWSLGLAVSASGEATATDVIEHTTELGSGITGGIASFGRDLSGELYVVTFAGRVVKIVADAGPAPSAPQDVRAVVSGSTVTVSWTAPAAGAVPSSYRLEAGSVSGASDLGIVSTAGPETSLTFPGIPAGTYFVRVRSITGGGASVASNEVTIVVGGGGCGAAPPAPTDFASTVNGREVTLTWQVSSTASGPTSFSIEAGSASGAANLAMISIDGGLRSLSVSALPGRYFVRIRGHNDCGTSGASNEVTVTVF